MGAGFVHWFVPETKRLTLEEMDVIFGSEGTAQADYERMDEINKEIGLDAILRHDMSGSGEKDSGEIQHDEKKTL